MWRPAMTPKVPGSVVSPPKAPWNLGATNNKNIDDGASTSKRFIWVNEKPGHKYAQIVIFLVFLGDEITTQLCGWLFHKTL